mgnify:CR=1 FL=1
MPTPHIESEVNEIASIVLMPGDPNRAKYIADNYLINVKIVNKVRGINAYTGEYEGKVITIFPSGMGIPSMGIYSYELFNYYGVEKIIRIGTMGAYNPELKLGDIVITNRAYSDSSFAKVQSDYKKNYLDADNSINKKIIQTADEMKINYVKGNIFTSDVFYEKEGEWLRKRKQFNVLGVEMETFGLLQTARICNKKATAIFTISDSFCFEEKLSSEEREKNLNNMIELALKTSLKL